MAASTHTDAVLQRFQSTWSEFLNDLEASYGDYLAEPLNNLRNASDSPREVLQRIGLVLLPKSVELAARHISLFEGGLVLEGLDLGALALAHESSRIALYRYLETFFLLSTAVHAGGLGTAATAAKQVSETLQEVISEFLQDEQIQNTLSELRRLVPSDPKDLQVQKLIPLIAQFMNSSSPLQKKLRILRDNATAKIRADPTLGERVKSQLAPLLAVLRDLGLPIPENAFDISTLFQNATNAFSGVNPGKMAAPLLNMLTKYMSSSSTQADDDELPELEQIERSVNKQMIKEFREGSREASMRLRLQKKLQQRQKERNTSV